MPYQYTCYIIYTTILFYVKLDILKNILINMNRNCQVWFYLFLSVKITNCETLIMDKSQITNGKFDRMNLANEMGNTGVENWLEKTSKYHSLEMEDDE